ncbi:MULTISPECIES: Sec-independent protein translocase subunit TatA [Arthrobacter]|uniref:Sec-independent protein translocase protein TatA n=1 Tax=Arthrobacter psychrochitiniphilus TaxID=291045 RepID=A0A2V3DQE2_9MICC|nr:MULTISPECIES: Sec-independent protein translocase subunit TatA [Arthrobacter]NYG17049.1 sec-independent protein translocase protein TatA [Arthrobacter psychrochitiniphilus]PXA64739.1 Sec-independent protein translocase TatA [Arthrobacter psychrochitiniphilus]
MGRLFESPWAITIIIIVVLLLFAAPKLPGMARSLGQSMRIIKSEVKEMKNDGKDETPPSAPPAAPQSTDVPFEGKIVNNPAQGDGTGTGTGAQS